MVHIVWTVFFISTIHCTDETLKVETVTLSAVTIYITAGNIYDMCVLFTVCLLPSLVFKDLQGLIILFLFVSLQIQN